MQDQASSHDPGSSDADSRVWRDGELIDFAEATIHVLSHAASRGTLVFDVLRLADTGAGPTAIGLRAHVARFARSMELMGMQSPYDVTALEQAVAETAMANPGTAIVKLVAAWVEVAPTSVPASLRPSVHVAALAADDLRVLGDPASVATAEMPKIPSSVLPPSVKVAASYSPAVRHQMAAQAAGYDDVLFKAFDGSLAEATTQSLMVVLDGRILVPSLDVVLDGVTRRLLLDLAHHIGTTVEVRDVKWEEVEQADELILTSTTRFVRPVATLDERTMVAPGPMAEALAAEAELVLTGTHELSDRWLTPLQSLLGDPVEATPGG